jgi:hypothetical protein
MTESSSSSKEKSRAQGVAHAAVRARVVIVLSTLAVVGAAVSLLNNAVDAPIVGGVLGFVLLLIILAQIALRSYLMQHDQLGMLQKTEKAVEELEIIRTNTEEELRVEERQTRQLELLFTAMKEFNLLEVKSLEALEKSLPTTSFYLQRHATAIMEILKGHWDRSEFLRPQQLWHEYAKLVTLMRRDEIFRSTVCIPPDPADLFEDEKFNKYVDAIYKSAKSQGVQVRRLFVLDCEVWPPDKGSLDAKLLEHLEKLQEVESAVKALQVRVTMESTASQEVFHRSNPDLMIWGDGLLILSDLSGPNGLVTQAEFFFANNSHSEQISKRQVQFDELFKDPERALTLAEVI